MICFELQHGHVISVKVFKFDVLGLADPVLLVSDFGSYFNDGLVERWAFIFDSPHFLLEVSSGLLSENSTVTVFPLLKLFLVPE